MSLNPKFDLTSQFVDNHQPIDAWNDEDIEYENGANLFKILSLQISQKNLKPSSAQKDPIKPIPLFKGRQVHSSIENRKFLLSKEINFMKNKQISKTIETKKKQIGYGIEEGQKKYISQQTMKKEGEKLFLDLKKQSLIFDSSRKLKTKNTVLNMKKINIFERKNNNKQKEGKLELLITKKNKQNSSKEPLLRVKDSPIPHAKFTSTVSKKNQWMRVNAEKDAFSDVHFCKNVKFWNDC